MSFSRRGVFVRMVFLASCIATAGELAAQPKLAEISKDAARRSK